MQVDRCVCFEVSFGELKAYVEKTGGGFDELTVHFGCGRGCGLCVPYIRKMLETGETAFPLIPPGEPASPAD